MLLSDIFLGLGEESFTQLVRSVSMGRLKIYQLFERMKARLHLHKLNSESFRKAEPRMWARLQEKDDEFATDIAQAVLVSHLDMVKAVLNHLGIPHEEGFFAKDADVSSYLKEGWQQDVYDTFREAYPGPALLFYINHLAWEITKAGQLFAPAAPAA